MRPSLAPDPRPTTPPADATGVPVRPLPGVLPDVRSAPLVLGALALGCALQVNFGQYHPVALAWLTLALTILGLCSANPHAGVAGCLERHRRGAFALALAVQFGLLFSHSPGATGLLAGEAHLGLFRAGIAVSACVCIGGLWLGDRRRPLAIIALLTLHALLGVWVLRATPGPGVDVALFQRDSAEALLRGENPYAITFDDPYADSSRFYGPGLSRNGRLQFGYPYPPLTLLLATPAHLLGDFRYAQLAAMTLAGALIAFARPGRVAFAAAALLLFTPRGFFVLEAGWTEPFAVLFLAATVFAACRAPGSLPVPLGLLLVSKQYLVLALLATPLLGKHRGIVLRTAAVAALVTLPLALWHLPAFVRSVVLLQFHQPFREDALSFLVPMARLTGIRPPAWIALALALPAGLILARKLPRTAAGFSAAVAIVCLVFFAFNKQAFCNYYYFVIGALCCAAGSASGSFPRPDDALPRR